MSAPAPLIGRWRIVEADRRDRGHLGLGSHAIPKPNVILLQQPARQAGCG
jgi:hypothetical protein